ncbi:hypothetical protein O6H91_09G019200 [Diphasiastrum complanatum]|uniref:Uncharacterized protein n=1 Tax=Diphasiastrum complanatum TaxID=34168 RepID=A0ACC2CLS8_DIPCM|nr:hypothetical protein O6H91_09G019200 [Diphasiastrum complanatum]
MDRLPIELPYRIFSLLDYRHLAAMALVCRDWNSSSEQAELWQQLFTQRWGQAKAKDACFKHLKSWKQAYEVQDRCDRLGVAPKIAREGPYYFLVSEGAKIRFLGSTKMRPWLEQQTSVGLELGNNTQLDMPRATTPAVKSCNSFSNVASSRRSLMNLLKASEQCPGDAQVRIVSEHSHVGLFDKLLFFLGDLESAIQSRKRKKVV